MGLAYRYLDHLSYADASFEVAGDSLEEVFIAAADALENLLVEDLSTVFPDVIREVELGARDNELLLHDFLQMLIYWKDTEGLLLRVRELRFDLTRLKVVLHGEALNPERHALGTDVKAITYHGLKIWREGKRWKATVVVDT